MHAIRPAVPIDAAAIAAIHDPMSAERASSPVPTQTRVRIADAADAAPVGASGCCGGPAKTDASACCVKDEVAKAAGTSGCGCGAPSPAASTAAGERE